MQNTCHPSFQDGLTNILAQTSCHKQIRAFVCDVRGCNFEAARQLQQHKLMLTTILRRSMLFGSACLRATFGRLRNRMIQKNKPICTYVSAPNRHITRKARLESRPSVHNRTRFHKNNVSRYWDEEQGNALLQTRPAYYSYATGEQKGVDTVIRSIAAYISSGAEMPSNPNPHFITLPTALVSARRALRVGASSTSMRWSM